MALVSLGLSHGISPMGCARWRAWVGLGGGLCGLGGGLGVVGGGLSLGVGSSALGLRIWLGALALGIIC